MGAAESGLRARVVGTVASGNSKYLIPASTCKDTGLICVPFFFLPINTFFSCEISQF